MHYSLLVLLLFVNCCFGIVKHTTNVPNNPTNVVGMWGTNASCVVISEDYIITTRHQNYYSGTIVNIDNTNYTIDNAWVIGQADLRLVHLKDCKLIDYVSIYNGPTEVGKYIIIGGYGNSSTELYDSTAYLWDNLRNLNWCSNIVDNCRYNEHTYSNVVYVQDLLECDFDNAMDATATEYEGSIAKYDSGGGWFVYDTTWEVIALNCYVSHDGYSQFIPPSKFYGIRLSNYYDEIYTIINTNNIIEERDFNDDGIINLLDYQILVNNLYGECPSEYDINVDDSIDIIDVQELFRYWLQKNV